MHSEDYQKDRLGQLEYEEVLFYNISKLVVNRSYIAQNSLFWNSVVFKMFEEYYYGIETVSIKQQAKVLEILMYNIFKYKPSLDLPEDVLQLD